MKAVTWRQWLAALPGYVAFGIGLFAMAVPLGPALAAKQTAASASQPFSPSLPDGLPELPGLGETMQRDLRSGLALNGFDPVAYQAQGRAVAGSQDFELIHDGIVWRFASAANREAFRDAPGVYEPAYAGFDATGVAQGHAVESNPRYFAILRGRLFLFRSAESLAAFLADDGLARLAAMRWNEVYRYVAR